MFSSLQGLKELNAKLEKLDAIAAKKSIRSALTFATSLEIKEMKAAAPRGNVLHKTHKGRLVAPGFLSRSIKRHTKFTEGKASQVIGVRSEAFYGVLFLDKGTKKIRARNWFAQNFIDSERVITDRFANKLKEKIKAIR